MFEYFSMIIMPKHMYSVSVIGAKIKSKDFASRDEANNYMYKMVNKLNLGQLNKMYDDKHDKAYIYNDGITFYINRK